MIPRKREHFVPSRKAAAIATLLAALLSAGSMEAAAANDDLLQRYETLAREFDRSEREAVAVDTLIANLVTLVDDLEAAGMDSLAVDTITRAQSLYTRRSELEEARALLARGIALARGAGMRRAEGVLTMSMAVTYAIAGDFELFIGTASPLLALFEEIGDERMAAACWFNVGVAYTKLGRFPEAIAAIEESMAIARRINDRQRLGGCYAMATELNLTAGRLAAAAELVDSAVAITREIGRAVPLGAALTVQGLVYEAQGEVDRAIASVDEAIAVREKIGDEVYVTLSRLQKGLLLLRAGRPAECAALVDAMRPQLLAQGDPTQVHTATELECQALFEMGRYDEAEARLVEAIERFEGDRRLLRELQSQAGFFGTGGEYYTTLARCYLRRNDYASAWAAVERGHGALLAGRADTSAAVPARVGLAELQDRLARDHAALLHFNDPHMSPLLAFVVTAGSVEAVELPFASVVAGDARQALDLMASGSPDELCDPALRRVAEALHIDRLRELAPDVERLYVVPPASLAGFPLEALPLGPDGESVGDRFAVAYVASGSWLVRAAPPTTHRAIIAVADPVVELNGAEPEAVNSQLRSLAASPLPRARQEIRVLDGDDTRSHVGEQATRSQLGSADAGGVGVLHFATHAIVNPYAPERSCLLLAGADGVLEANEVETLPLDADLVTLSGCETSGGFAYLGEGTFGLTRSFLVAGARSVVSSLWKIEDRAASRFMTEFYDHLRDGQPRDMSMRLARRALREDGYPHRDRSAFVLTGVGAEPVFALAALGPRHGGRPGTAVLLLALLAAGVTLVVVLARRRPAR